MTDLIVKLLVTFLALTALPWLVEGRVKFALTAAGMVQVAGREFRFAAFRYRPNRSYFCLAMAVV